MIVEEYGEKYESKEIAKEQEELQEMKGTACEVTSSRL
jgi:hypothetical protein